MEKIGIFIVALVVVVLPVALLNGWALMLLWEWFVVPVTDLRALVYGEALGMSLVVSYMTTGIPDVREKSTSEALKAVGWLLAKPFWALTIGWIYLAVFFE